MDWSDPQVISFARSLVAMDDDALAALANKGLLRRAQKDLQARKPELSAADAASVTLTLEGQTVRLTQPAAKSTCTCASGICRHILASLIHLRDSAASAPKPAAPDGSSSPSATAAPEAPAVDPAQWMLDLDEAAILKWAGKPILKRAVVAVSQGYEVEPAAASIAVRLPAQNIIVRGMPGGLDAMLCSCHAAGACEHKVAAILAVRAQRTGKTIEIPGSILQASSGAPRSHAEVRACVLELLGEMIGMGLSRLSPASGQRLGTLATSAHGVDLPRLSRMLRSLADEVTRTLKRDASASTDALLISCARVAALCEALQRPTPGLVGEFKSVYRPVAGSIELVGLGARQWRTRSGYHGLTVYFWEAAGRRWSSWNDARPIGVPGFNPVSRFDEMGPWNGCANPRQAACTLWRLSGAHRNSAGRVAARDNTRGIATRKAAPDDGPLVKDFSQLASLAHDAFAPGLGDRRAQADLVLLGPASWADADYDPIKQEVTRPVLDEQGRAVPLVLAHSPETDRALTTLQQIDAATVQAVLGSLRIGPHGLFVEPITFWTKTGPLHLTLDGTTYTIHPTAPAKAPDAHKTPESEQPTPEDEERTDDEAEEAIPVVEGSAVGHLLGRIERELVAVAESGVGVLRDLSLLRDGARHLFSIGMRSVATLAGNLAAELDSHRSRLDADPAQTALNVLRCAYAIHVAQACQALAMIGQ